METPVQEMSQEQIAQMKATQTAEKAAEKAAKKEEADKKKAEKAAEKAAKKEAEKAQKEAEKAAKKEAQEQAKIAAKAATKQPEQNGVRRPKPETLCGRAWAIFDGVSSQLGSPAPIRDCLVIARDQGLNENNVKVEYAQWRKFNGVSGRITSTIAVEKAAPAPVEQGNPHAQAQVVDTIGEPAQI